MSPPRIGASTMPLQMKDTQPQQSLAAGILKAQQSAAYSYFMPQLPQQLLQASIYFNAIATISYCSFTIKAAISIFHHHSNY